MCGKNVIILCVEICLVLLRNLHSDVSWRHDTNCCKNRKSLSEKDSAWRDCIQEDAQKIAIWVTNVAEMFDELYVGQHASNFTFYFLS